MFENLGLALIMVATPSFNVNIAPALYMSSSGKPSLSVMTTLGMSMPIAEKVRLGGEIGIAALQNGSLVPRAGTGLIWGVTKEIGIATMFTFGTDWSLKNPSIGFVVNPSIQITDNIRVGIGTGLITTFGGSQPALGFTAAPRITVSF